MEAANDSCSFFSGWDPRFFLGITVVLALLTCLGHEILHRLQRPQAPRRQQVGSWSPFAAGPLIQSTTPIVRIQLCLHNCCAGLGPPCVSIGRGRGDWALSTSKLP